jgi:hypothetical protein
MSLFDRLKPTPRWKHADAQIRLSAVQDFDMSRGDAADVLATLARGDADPRVRRAAIARLADPGVLSEVLRQDSDEAVRQAAAELLLAEATRGGADSTAALSRAEAALAGLSEPRHLSTVAKTAALEPIRRAAVDRLSDGRALASVARNATDPAVALLAVERLQDEAELLTVAMRSDHRDAAVAAFERIAQQKPGDIDTFRAAAGKAVNKAVQKRARVLIQQYEEAEAARRAEDEARRQREVELCQRVEALGRAGNWQEARAELERVETEWRAMGDGVHADLAERFAAATSTAQDAIADRERESAERAAREAEREEALGQRRALVERVRTLPPGDDLLDQVALIRAEWEGLPPADGHTDEAFAIQREFEAACQQCHTAQQNRQAVAAAMRRLEDLAPELEATAAIESLDAARERWLTLERDWREQSSIISARPGTGLDDEPRQARYRQAAAHLEQRLTEQKQGTEKSQRDTLRRLERLAERLEKRATAEDLSLKEAERGVRELREAIDDPGTLPSREDRDRVLERLRAAHTALAPRARELREADDWKRFANATVQEELCARAEALLQKISAEETPDLEAAARELRQLNMRWRDVAEAPRGQAQLLWHRYRRAFDQVRARCQDFFAQQAAQRGENLMRKDALVRRAEELAGSTDWIRTADELRKLQAEWKTVGPIPRDQARVLWDRFRTACDQFFTRKQEDLNARKQVWSANLERKEALVRRAEELAESTDWDHAAAELRRLQAEWKTVGPVRKNKGEVLWGRFRGACDKFFERHKQRDQIALTERLAAREAAIVEMEALAAAEQTPEDLAAQIKALRQRWEHGGPVPHGTLEPLQQRYEAALERLAASHADQLRGTDLDPDNNLQRMQKLVAKVEKLVSDQVPASNSSEALAAMLREALAGNQIGGRSSEDSRWRAAVEEVKQAQAAWKRIGPVPPEAGRELAERFRHACDRVFEQHRRKAMATRG